MLKACSDFADKRMQGSEALYRARGELNSAKIKQDIINGAMAEHAVQQYLVAKGLQASAPDLAIYKGRQKSFSADITAADKKFHVKSQTKDSADKYGLSWLFQEQDKILTLPGENSFLVLCMVDGEEVHIKAIINEVVLSEANIVSKPKIGRYANTKKAIYFDDLLKSNLNLWGLE